MNPYNMANNITLTRAEMQEFSEKMQQYKMLKNTVETQNVTINSLTKENKELKKQIKKIEDENKAKAQDMKQKFMELHSEQKKVNNELEKYQAVPEFKGILDLYSELLDFRKKVDNVFKNDPVYQERRKLDKKIEDYKQKNFELEMELKRNGGRITVKTRTNELQQAEMELRKVKEQVQMRYIGNRTKVNEMTTQMKNSTTKLVSTMTKALMETQKHLEKFNIDLQNISKSCNEFVEKPIYDSILNILLEQQNGLMKDMLQCTASGMSSVSIKDDEYFYESGTESPDEDDVESLRGDGKHYKIIMHNVNEEWTDGLSDLQKVQAILRTFTTVSVNDVQVERMGKMNPAKKRPIKVLLPTFQHVQVILKTKTKLQNTCYSDVRICSFKNKLPTKSGPPKRGGKRNY